MYSQATVQNALVLRLIQTRFRLLKISIVGCINEEIEISLFFCKSGSTFYCRPQHQQAASVNGSLAIIFLHPEMCFRTLTKKTSLSSYQKPDGRREPGVGLHHLRRLLLDDERSEKIIKMGPTFVKYIQSFNTQKVQYSNTYNNTEITQRTQLIQKDLTNYLSNPAFFDHLLRNGAVGFSVKLTCSALYETFYIFCSHRGKRLCLFMTKQSKLLKWAFNRGAVLLKIQSLNHQSRSDPKQCSSLVEGHDDCISPLGKLLCLRQITIKL